MERDALLAHGTSFLLQDRLMNCSDYSTAWICKRCGLLSSLGYDINDDVGLAASSQHHQAHQAEPKFSSSVKMRGPQGEYCRQCEPDFPLKSAEHSLPSTQNGQSLESLSGQLTNHMDVIAIPYVSLSLFLSFHHFIKLPPKKVI
jgi:DNA-directed RNA polymerase I subunit RPA2